MLSLPSAQRNGFDAAQTLGQVQHASNATESLALRVKFRDADCRTVKIQAFIGTKPIRYYVPGSLTCVTNLNPQWASLRVKRLPGIRFEQLVEDRFFQRLK